MNVYMLKSLLAWQALGDAERQSYMKGKRILEVNPRHPLIQQVKDKFEADPENAANGALAKILYETALLESGFQVWYAHMHVCSQSTGCSPVLTWLTCTWQLILRGW